MVADCTKQKRRTKQTPCKCTPAEVTGLCQQMMMVMMMMMTLAHAVLGGNAVGQLDTANGNF